MLVHGFCSLDLKRQVHVNHIRALLCKRCSLSFIRMKWRMELLVPTVSFSKSQLRNFPSSIISSPVVFFCHFLCSLQLSTWPKLRGLFYLNSQTCHLPSSEFLFINNADQWVKGERVVTHGKWRTLLLHSSERQTWRSVFWDKFQGSRK